MLFGAEQVGIILREAAHAGHAAEFAGFFPAVDGAEFGQPYGQIAIAVRVAGVNADVMRAVHRLEQVAVDFAFFHAVGQIGAAATLLGKLIEILPVDQRRELALAIVRVMTAGLIQIEPADMRGENLLISLPP